MSEYPKAPLAVLQQYWGYDSFRSLQDQIIESVLNGKDTLGLMPTGGGKSICFQVPALCREGICIVVSPLIALMKDQVENLKKRGILAEAIYSGMHYRDIDRILDNCIYGNVKLLYLSPERLTTDLAKERIKQMNVSLLAVDEAHCVSQWGYDFRPSYLQIAEAKEWLPEVPTLALTATATPEVVKDIQEKLAFRQQNVFQKSFERNNLSYSVLYEEGKEAKLLDIFRKVKGTGIVYVRSRRKTKEIAIQLQRNGIRADFYHAGLSPDLRAQKQDAWVNDQLRVIVSTNAFGMGIDKSDVRIVVHMDLPDSLEAYFQEAGRAGRDGQKAYAVLLYNETDKKRLERSYELAFPPMTEIRRIYRALGSYFQLALGAGEGHTFDFDIIAFCQNFQLDPIRTYNALKTLEKEGWIMLTDAVYIPSSLKILVSKEDLYDYQLRNPKMDIIIKTILRTYQGAFNQYVHLRENQLARFLKMSRADLNKALAKLSQDKVIRYEPQKDSPQLFYAKERIRAEDLTIDQSRYHFLKNRYYERIKKAILYAEDPVCRSQQLLQYFGEEEVPKCGICDVCLGRTKAEITEQDFKAYQEKIRRLLKKERLSLDNIMDSFAPRRHQQVLKALEYLLDEGFIDKEGEHFFLNER
ncbi:MAG: RecQ family ATP-dependent DNA helicase [Saprospiraceae bacterium]|nr:RecQ family ATP-dependent DNA helicase [Saprospiraceae bacterium]